MVDTVSTVPFRAQNSAYTRIEPKDEPSGSKIKRAITDGAIGIGHGISKAFESNLLQQISPRIFQIGTGIPRILGGGVTFLTSGLTVARTFLKDLKRGDGDFAKTRKEIFLTSASVGSGILGGTLAGIGGAALIASGASAALVGGFTVVSAVLIGGTVYRVRGLVERWYDKL